MMDASVLTPDDVVYYLAVSLDGYLATPDGGTAWLDPYFIPELGFHDFIARVRTVLMGRRTWDRIEGFGKWPYGDLPGIVATSRPLGKLAAPVTAAEGTPAQIFAAAQKVGPGPYWLVGGAHLATGFLEAGLLTRIDLFTIPVLLGAGIPAFINRQQITLDLIDAETYPKGIVRTSWRPQPRVALA
jgi:dihydrofolate reductase